MFKYQFLLIRSKNQVKSFQVKELDFWNFRQWLNPIEEQTRIIFEQNGQLFQAPAPPKVLKLWTVLTA